MFSRFIHTRDASVYRRARPVGAPLPFGWGRAWHPRTVLRSVSDSLSRRIARGIREQRQRRRLSQLALAEAAGLSIDHISKVERGLREPRLGVVDRVARALGVDPAELLVREAQG